MNAKFLTPLAALLLAGILPVTPALARPDPVRSPVVLVATTNASDTYGELVILAVPLGDESHFGFVLNQPSETSLGELFPDEEASHRVPGPVHIGGPELRGGVFALVREPASAPEGVVRITPEIAVALDNEAVDRVIAERPAAARFYMGLVFWRPGELASEISAANWQVLAPDAGLVMSAHPATLWQRLAPRAPLHSAAARSPNRPPQGTIPRWETM